MRAYFYLYIVFVLAVSCGQINSSKEKDREYPLLINFNIGEDFDINYQNPGGATIIWISNETNNLNLDSIIKVDTSFHFYKQSNIPYPTDSTLKIIIDTNQIISTKTQVISKATLKETSNNLFYHYDSIIINEKQVKSYPVFILNMGDSLFKIATNGNHIVTMQEALDSNGKWVPIECLPTSMCGNSYAYTFIRPKSYILFAIPIYSGTFRTKLRLKLRISKKIIISNEYFGEINPEQMNKNNRLTSGPFLYL